MKKKTKIIHIISHTPPYHLYPNQDPPVKWRQEDGSICGFWDYEWPHIIYSQVMKYSDQSDFIFEVWQPDLRAKSLYTYKFENGLIHRLFPAVLKFTKLTFFGGKKELFSSLMQEQIRQELKEYNIIIHVFLNNRYNIRLLLTKFNNKIPFLFQFAHNPYEHPYFGKGARKTLKRTIQNMLLASFYQNIKYVFTSTNSGIKKYDKVVYFQHENLSNIGVDFEKLYCSRTKVEAREVLNIPKDKKVFFASQRIVPEKQIVKLIDAVAELEGDNFIFYISGAGSEKYIQEIIERIEKKKLLNKVILTSYLDFERLKLYYKAADYFISTSKVEAGPDSVYKALFYELPVITTNTGIAYEFLRSRNVGVYINSNDSSLWARVLQKIVDKEVMIKIPKKKEVMQFFNWSNVCAYYIKTFNTLIDLY